MVSVLRTLGTRLLPALLTAAGIVLITAGLLSYADPTTAGTAVVESPEVGVLGPSDSPQATPSAGTPGATPSAGPDASAGSGAPETPAGSVPASIVPDPTKKPGRAVATRVLVPALNIDLPVVRGNDGYPLCNVALYLHTANAASKDAFGQPGEGRATYLYAHARDGMFGPIYDLAIRRHNAKKMLGMVVQVYTSDNKLYLYEIHEYRLHVTSLDSALGVKDEELWLQTSEGPKGTPGKTQLRALPISVSPADPAAAHPKAKPVACG